MNNQEYIKSLCLLGADRQQLNLDQLKAPLDELINQIEGEDSAEKILHALSLDHFYRLAGTELPKMDKVIDMVPIIEDGQYAPDAYYEVLKQILDTEKQQTQMSLLMTWINKLREQKTIVHPMHLVKYLNALTHSTKAIKELAAPTLGKKGTWLCQQNPKYDKLLSQVEFDVWSFGTTQQRNAYLSDLLMTDPGKALQKVEENWDTESAREKLKHLKLILNKTNDSFLPFIQKLYDKEFAYQKKETVTSRDCRKTVAKILLLHPSSALYQQTIKSLSEYLAPQNKGFIAKVFQSQSEVLNIPETDDHFFNSQHMHEVYGIDPKTTQSNDFRTDQLYWFSELCSAIPFDIWTSLTNLSAKNVLASFLESEQYQIVVDGKKVSSLKNALTDLAARYHKDEFTIMLLDQEKNKDVAGQLLASLSTSAWENYLMKNKNIIDNYILRHCPHPKDSTWSLQFSKKILDYTTVQYNNNANLYDYSIGNTMSEFIHIEATDYLMQLNSGKAQKNEHYNYWKTHIFDPIYQTIKIKNQIHNL